LQYTVPKQRNLLKPKPVTLRLNQPYLWVLSFEGPGWLNELGSWITLQAYHQLQYGVGSRRAL